MSNYLLRNCLLVELTAIPSLSSWIWGGDPGTVKDRKRKDRKGKERGGSADGEKRKEVGEGKGEGSLPALLSFPLIALASVNLCLCICVYNVWCKINMLRTCCRTVCRQRCATIVNSDLRLPGYLLATIESNESCVTYARHWSETSHVGLVA